jgi:hypothetical protein
MGEATAGLNRRRGAGLRGGAEAADGPRSGSGKGLPRGTNVTGGTTSELRVLKAFGNWCATEEVAAAGRFRRLRRPKVPHRLIAPFSDAELRVFSPSPTGERWRSCCSTTESFVFRVPGAKAAIAIPSRRRRSVGMLTDQEIEGSNPSSPANVLSRDIGDT